jgi:hypothetical protein
MTDIVCIAIPGVLSKWATQVVLEAAAIAHADGLVDMRWVGADDDVSTVGAGTAPRRQVIATQSPGGMLVDIVQTRPVWVVYVIEDPLDAVAYARQTGLPNLMDAVRMVCAATTVSLVLPENRHVLFVHRGPSIMAREQIAAILAHMSLGLSETQELSLLEKYGGKAADGWSLETALSRQVEHYAPAKRAQADFATDSEAAAIAQAVDPLLRMACGAPLEPIVWTDSMVFDEHKHEPIGAGAIELVGGRRSLLHGPFVAFPPGRYRITLTLDIEEDAVGLPFALELSWGNDGKRLVSGRAIEPELIGPQIGSFEAVLDHADEVLDVRLKLCTAMLDDGRIRFKKLEFLPQPR